MRIKVKDYKEMEKLAKEFEECHMEADPNGIEYLVIDKVKRMKA